MLTRFVYPFALMISLSAIVGCGPSIPELVPASGRLTINGDPVPHAKVSFIPMADGLDGNHTSSGLTDEDGNFSLEIPTGESGAYACLNKITVRDGPAPAAARSQDPGSAQIWDDFKKSLKNRPIPDDYRSLSGTPLEFTVSGDQAEYNIEITR